MIAKPSTKAALIALALLIALLVLATSCSAPDELVSAYDIENKTFQPYRHYDARFGVVCYYWSNAIDCVKLEE